MHQYLLDTAFAAKGLIDLIIHDSQELKSFEEKQKLAIEKVNYFETEFSYREMEASANYWHGRLHEAHKERVATDEQVKFLQAQIFDKRFSLEALAAALLQLAKQGISTVWGPPSKCPCGRKVQGVDLKSVIWAGRNQAQHYEEPKKVDDNTAGVFTQLNAFAHSAKQLDPRSKTNLAFEIVTLLGWHDYANHQQDMVSLIG